MAEIVQIRNPKTGNYIRINKTLGKITGHKIDNIPYKNIKIIEVKQSG